MKKLYFWANVILKGVLDFVLVFLVLGAVFVFFMFVGMMLVCQIAGFWFMMPWYVALPFSCFMMALLGVLFSALGVIGIPGCGIINELMEECEKYKEYLRNHGE